MDILTRTGIALAIIFAGLSLYRLYNRKIKLRIQPLLRALGPLRPMTFALVYFTMPGCVPCKTIQRPAIQRLSNFLEDGVQVFEFDVTRYPYHRAQWSCAPCQSRGSPL